MEIRLTDYQRISGGWAGCRVSGGDILYVGFRVGGDKLWDIPGSVGDQLKAKSFNAGLNLGAGVELIKHLQVGFNYALGLTDDYSASKLELNGKNRGWSITAAILF